MCAYIYIHARAFGCVSEHLTIVHMYMYTLGGAVAQWLERRTGNGGDLGSNPADSTSLRNISMSIPFTPLYQYISEETLKAICSFYLVSMPGELKLTALG